VRSVRQPPAAVGADALVMEHRSTDRDANGLMLDHTQKITGGGAKQGRASKQPPPQPRLGAPRHRSINRAPRANPKTGPAKTQTTKQQAHADMLQYGQCRGTDVEHQGPERTRAR
jgi:hypothetical protein